MPLPEPGSPPAGADFTQTRWSVILAAGCTNEATAQPALAWLCERYWFPLFAYVRGRGYKPHEAEDLVQSFFARLLTDNLVARADAERGRFRSFLLGCLTHFLANEWRRGQRLKRGGALSFLELEHPDLEERLQHELADARTPALDYDRAWALTVLDRAMAALRLECDGDGHEGRFAVLQVFIQGERGELPLAEAGAALGLSLPAVKSIVHRLRQRFRVLVLAEVRQTVDDETAVPGELEHLFRALSR